MRGLLGAALTTLTIGTTIGAVAAQRGAPPVPAPMPAVLRDYRPVTAERLKNPEDENWLMIRRTHDGWGFSPLTQITPANAARLRPVWGFSTAEARVHQAAPLAAWSLPAAPATARFTRSMLPRASCCGSSR